MKPQATYIFGSLLLAIAACGSDPTPDPDCVDDECEAAESRDELLAEIEGFSDPISSFLRTAVQEDGSLDGDYRDILDGLGGEVGCGPSTESSFIVLSNENLNPKTVFNRCASSPIQASEFFLLLPALDSQSDLEPQLVHMTAWDPQAKRYRRYSTFPNSEGGMAVNVEPSFCLTCHAGPRELGTWQPLMNEMTNPWSQWNAEPGFASHVFDDYLASATANGQVFAEVSAEGLLDSASNFEPIIRAGIDRVTGARVQNRHNPANKAEALKLLQPLFCDEHLNFVSEIHGSGEIRSSALIDDSFRELFVALDLPGDFAFLQDTAVRIDPPTDGESNLTLMAVRGESTLRAELSLVTRLALTPLQVLQIRSLDWTRPVASDFRCGLFEAAESRIAAGAIDDAVDALGEEATNVDLLPLVLAEIMLSDQAGTRVDLRPAGSAVYSVPDAQGAPFLSLLGGGDLATLETSPTDLATALQASLDGANRADMDASRRQRACDSQARYPTAPIFPDINCE